jgi:hypothetical protein
LACAAPSWPVRQAPDHAGPPSPLPQATPHAAWPSPRRPIRQDAT